jgi:aminocarboxymuconate-semialdehyde decarboxylase
MYIDTDTHFLPRTWLDRVDHPLARRTLKIEWRGDQFTFLRDGKKVFAFGPEEWDLEHRIPHMDAEGFDIQVLIPENRPLIYEMDPDLGCALARAYNDAAVADCRGHDRFLAVAWVYLPDIQEATREMERAVRELGMRAVKVMGGFEQVHLGSETLHPFYKKAAELDIPILVHPPARTYDAQPLNPLLVGADRFGDEFGFLSSGLGFPFTYMVIMAHLIFSGTMDRFPTLKFGFFEAGAGWVPYTMNRLDIYYEDDLRRPASVRRIRDLQKLPSEYFERFYVAVHSKESYLDRLVKTVPAHRFMVGSDFPHKDPSATWPHTMSDLQAIPGLSRKEKERILATNPREFFGLEKAGARI